MRPHLDYTQRRDVQAVGFDPSLPITGTYRMKLRSGGLHVGIRIWHGLPKDPITGEELDRSPRWQSEANGEYIDIGRCWPRCAADPIDESEHAHLIRVQAWAKEHAPHSPQADPRRRIDPLTAPLPQI